MSYVRNVFSPEEQKEIDGYYDRAKGFIGWMDDKPRNEEPYPIWNWTLSKEQIVHNATIADYKNLLHRDPEYAKRTRWGGLIAPPFMAFCIASGMSFNGVHMPPDVGTPYYGAMGEGFDWIGVPIRPGDQFRIWTCDGDLTDITPDGESFERILLTHDRFKIFNQRDELVCVFNRQLVHAYTDPGYKPDDELFHFMGPFNGSNLKFTEEKHYTREEVDAIEKFYWDEKRQGKEIRCWEDVKLGDELYPIELGPITVWETTMAMATFGCVPAPVWHIKDMTPERIFYDPETNIPHKNIEFHLDPAFARKIGFIPEFYSSTLIQSSMFNFFGRLLSNWMGDDGFIRRHQWMKFTNTPFGDTVFGYGRVVRKYIDGEGRCLVDIDCWMENVRGFVSNTGFATIELMSYEKMNFDRLPACDNAPRSADTVNPEGFKRGDHVRIKPRPDWPLPTPHPTAGHTAVIVDPYPHPDLGAYCFVAFDEPVTGLDPRIVVGMRYDMMERI